MGTDSGPSELTKEEKAIIRAIFGRETGRATREEKALQDRYRQLKQIKALEDLGLMDSFLNRIEGKNGEPREGDSQRSGGTAGGVLGAILGGAGEVTKESLISALGPTIAGVGTPIGLIMALWLAEERIEKVPPILHLLVAMLSKIVAVMEALMGVFTWLTGLDPFGALEDVKEKAAEIIDAGKEFVVTAIDEPTAADRLIDPLLNRMNIPEDKKDWVRDIFSLGVIADPLGAVKQALTVSEALGASKIIARIGLEMDKSAEQVLTDPKTMAMVAAQGVGGLPIMLQSMLKRLK